MQVSINEDLCTGCGLCVDTCPDVFVMSDDKAEVTVDEIPEEAIDLCKEAAENCPVEAIVIIEE